MSSQESFSWHPNLERDLDPNIRHMHRVYGALLLGGIMTHGQQRSLSPYFPGPLKRSDDESYYPSIQIFATRIGMSSLLENIPFVENSTFFQHSLADDLEFLDGFNLIDEIRDEESDKIRFVVGMKNIDVDRDEVMGIISHGSGSYWIHDIVRKTFPFSRYQQIKKEIDMSIFENEKRKSQ